jgi:hypothetical protein
MKQKRLSYKLHGVWVRDKILRSVGRISCYDRETGLVWVVWQKDKWRNAPGAGGVPPERLLRLTRYEPDPWIDKGKM